MRTPSPPLALRRHLLAAATGVALLSGGVVTGCGGQGGAAPKKAAPKGEQLAKVGSSVITVESLQEKLDGQSPFVRARYTEPGKLKEFVDGQVRFEVLAEEARARGYDQDPEVEEAIKKIIVQRLTREEFDGRVQLKDITDAELRTYFDAHQADYQKPAMVRASVIVFAAGAEAEAQKVSAEAAKKPDDRVAFKQLVEKNSTDVATKAAGGDLRYLSKDDVVSKFGEAAASWLFAEGGKVNEVSAPMAITMNGQPAVAVFKRTGERKPITRTFEQVKNQIRNVVYREKRTEAFNAFVDGLKTKHQVTLDESKIDKIKVKAVPMGALPPDGHGHGGHGLPPGHMPVDSAGGAEADQGGNPSGTDDDGHDTPDGEEG